MDIIYGRKPVVEALKGRRRVLELWIAESRSSAINGIIEMAAAKNIPIKQTKRERLEQLSSGGVHQGVVAKVSAFEFQTISKLTAGLAAKDKALVLLLDGVTDPQNLGSITRAAEVFAVDAIIIPPARTATVTPVVAKASAGAVEHLTMVQANLAGAAARLKETGFWLVGAEAGVDNPVWDFDWPPKTVLVLGSEGRGISHLVREKCDYLVNIPMFGHLESLNVAASGAVLLNEYRRRHRDARSGDSEG